MSLTTMLDRVLASHAQKRAARELARHTLVAHGDKAGLILSEMLADPARRRSRRIVRLAIARVRIKTNIGRPAGHGQGEGHTNA